MCLHYSQGFNFSAGRGQSAQAEKRQRERQRPRGPQLAKIVYEIPEFQNLPLEFQDSHQDPDKFQNFQCIPRIFTEF